MPDTLIGLGLAVAFVLPGFIIADLAETRRASRPAHSDLEIVLRGLAYALILQLVVASTGWTECVIEKVDEGDDWRDHVAAVALFALVVGAIAPTLIGLALSWVLRTAEQAGQLKAWHYALGGRDHREAWDFVFGRQVRGTYLLLTLTGADGKLEHYLAKYGRGSWASQAPTRPHEIYVQEVWPANAEGVVDEKDLDRIPLRGMWVSADQLVRLEVMHLPDGLRIEAPE